MAPTSCFSGQVHRLPDAPEAYGAMITRAKAAPAQSRSAALAVLARLPAQMSTQFRNKSAHRDDHAAYSAHGAVK